MEINYVPRGMSRKKTPRRARSACGLQACEGVSVATLFSGRARPGAKPAHAPQFCLWSEAGTWRQGGRRDEGRGGEKTSALRRSHAYADRGRGKKKALENLLSRRYLGPF
jgi:hypothetical protein